MAQDFAWINGCPHCEVADGVLATYRHAMKDVVRAETFEEAKAVMLKALADDGMKRLGKVFHQIVKHAVLLSLWRKNPDGEEYKKALKEMFDYIDQMNHGATVKGWLRDGRTA